MPYSKELKEAIEKELEKERTSTHHAIFLKMLEDDYRNGIEKSSRIDTVKNKYRLKN